MYVVFPYNMMEHRVKGKYLLTVGTDTVGYCKLYRQPRWLSRYNDYDTGCTIPSNDRTDFREMLCWDILRKSVDKIQMWLKSKNIGHFTRKPEYVVAGDTII